MYQEMSDHEEASEKGHSTAEEGGVVGEGVARRKHTPGIVYLSRIPPYMQPRKVRHIFSKFGEVGRVFLQPEGEECST